LKDSIDGDSSTPEMFQKKFIDGKRITITYEFIVRCNGFLNSMFLLSINKGLFG
jgi:hypothetical protein